MSKPLHICMVIDAWDPIWGGGQIYVDQLCKELVISDRATVDLFTRSLPGSKEEKSPLKGWEIIKVGPVQPFFSMYGRLATMVTLFRAMKTAHRQQPYDLVHAHTYLGVLPAYIFSKLCRLPLCVTVHGTNLTDLGKKGLIAWVERLIVVKLSYTATISVTHKYLDDYPKKKNVHWVPVGVDSDTFKPAAKTTHHSNQRLIFVGRFDPIKGLPLLVEALTKTDPSVELTLVGDGAQKDELVALVKLLGLQKRVTFAGYQNTAAVARLYQESDLFVLSSFSEGMPLTVLEAMASGLPVVCTKVGELPYLITEDKGWLAEPNSSSALAEAINRAVAHKMDWERMGKANAAYVRAQFDWPLVAKETYAIYSKLVSPHGS